MEKEKYGSWGNVHKTVAPILRIAFCHSPVKQKWMQQLTMNVRIFLKLLFANLLSENVQFIRPFGLIKLQTAKFSTLVM